MAIDPKAEWGRRPWWLNLILLFCLFMTFAYSPFDLLWKPLAEDEDVWLGFIFHGWQARVGGVLHLVVYGALSWGLWHMRPWAWLLGSLYATQVTIAMFMWPLINQQVGGGLLNALLAGGVFAVPTIALWRARALFSSPVPARQDPGAGA